MLSGHFGFEKKEDPQCTALDFISTQGTVFSKFTLEEDLLKINQDGILGLRSHYFPGYYNLTSHNIPGNIEWSGKLGL